MSDTATIEAPATESAATQESAPTNRISPFMEAAARDGFAPEEVIQAVKEQDAAKAAQPKAEAKAADQPVTTEVVEKQPEAKVVEKKVPAKKPVIDTSKNPWDAIDAIDAPKAKEEPVKEDPDLTPPKGLDEKGAVRWKELKQAEKELGTVKAELEKYKAGQTELTSKELEQLRQEKEEIEQLVAEKRLEKKPEFIESVVKPLQEASSEIARLADIGGINKAELNKALLITDKIERLDAIGKLIEEAEKPLRSMQENALYEAVEKIHKTWQHEDQLRAQAREIELAADAKTEGQKLQEQRAKEQEWKEANDDMLQKLASKIPLLKDKEFADQFREKVSRPSTPIDEAYNVQAGLILPHIMRERNEFAARISELESLTADISAARPSTSGKGEVAKDEKPKLTFQEALRLDGYA